jgi:hypothetical protein
MGNQKVIPGLRASFGPAGREWRLLRVKPRREKPFARSLEARGIANRVPCDRCERLYAGLSLNVEVPRFPGIVFVYGTPDEVCEATGCEGALGLIAADCPSVAERDLSETLRALNLFEQHGAVGPGAADSSAAMMFAATPVA